MTKNYKPVKAKDHFKKCYDNYAVLDNSPIDAFSFWGGSLVLVEFKDGTTIFKDDVLKSNWEYLKFWGVRE